jgi:hypothetical protein
MKFASLAMVEGTTARLPTKSRLFILPIMHERDMFMTMSNQSFEALLYAWTYAADDLIVASLIKPTCDYIKICSSLKLYQMLGQVIQSLSKRAIILCEYERHQKRSEDSTATRDEAVQSNLIENEIIRCFEDVLSSDWHSFHPASTRSSRTSDVTSSSLVWNAVNKIRGEILLKILFHFIQLSRAIIPHDAWTSIIEILLFARHHGILPSSLSTINNRYPQLVPGRDEIVVVLPQSIHIAKFLEAFDPSSKLVSQSSKSSTTTSHHQPANKAPTPISSSSSERRDSLRQSSSSIWKLLWSETNDEVYDESSGLKSSLPVQEVSSHPTDQLHNIHDLIHFLTKYPNISAAKSSSHQEISANIVDLSIKKMKGFDPSYALLRIVLQASDVDKILFHSTIDSELGEDRSMMIISIFDALMKILSDVLSQISSSTNAIQATRLQADAVVLEEWITIIITQNRPLVNSLWNKLHRSIFSVVFDNQHLKSTSRSSYFAERCLVNLFQAASQLLHSSEASEDVIWSSIHLVGGMSRADISSYGGVIGAGILTILRFVSWSD